MPEVASPDEDDNPGGSAPEGGGDGGGIGVGASFDGVEGADIEKEEAAKVGEADLGLGDDNGIVSGFDGVEDEKGDDTEESSSGGSGSSGDPSIEDAIESGLAEVAAVGLEGQERNEVHSEMRAIAGKFKIGYFGNRCVQKYLKRDIEDIPPEYGLVAALIAFGAIAVYKRPDGEERIQQAVSIVKEKVSGDGEPEPAPEPRRAPDPRPSRQPEPEQQRPVEQPQSGQEQSAGGVEEPPTAELVDEPVEERRSEVNNE